jgi:MFS family permease
MGSGGFASPGGSSASPVVIEQKLRAEQIVKSGAGWFLAIAGLSILNSVLTMSGAQFHFIFGLGITEIVDVIGRQSGATGSALGLVVNLFIAGFFLWFWYFGRKGEKWAFLTGMALYVMDGLLLIPFKDVLGVAFHAYALYRIYRGMQGIPVLEEIQRRLAPAGAPIEPS